MKPILEFEYYIENKTVKIQEPDNSRADFLMNESKHSEETLNEIVSVIGVNDKNANTIIKITYDIIMEKIRAMMIQKGYNANGQGAHEAEVSYLRKIGFSENDVQFCDQLRFFRNGIMYYGKYFDKEYALKTISFLKEFNLYFEK